MNKLLSSVFVIILALNFGCGGDDPPPEPPDTNPRSISATNGLYYKGVMDASTVDKPMAFLVRDGDGNPLEGQWVHFQRLIGDGTMVSDSLLTNASGNAIGEYVFDGSLGHAEILAYVRNVDSVIVSIRADVLITGANGQGQYILFSDLLEDVKNYNGLTTVDIYDNHNILYVDYEYDLGVVVMLIDDSLNANPNDTSEVYGVIVSDEKYYYEGKIADSIGIGSPYKAVYDYYGEPDTIAEDYDGRPAWRIKYLDEGLTFYGTVADTIINEIHLVEELISSSPASKIGASLENSLSGKGYHLHR